MNFILIFSQIKMKCQYLPREPVKCTKNMDKIEQSCHMHSFSHVFNENFMPDVVFNFSSSTKLSRKEKLKKRIESNDPVDREKAMATLSRLRAKKTRNRKARRNLKK